ncbi:hypothetical protein FH608_022200 [Nonomuraea phyllanthi]|uniref:Rod shape-determining protein n=1 Tax=Nonomuraea phyllanthi TaxID=2219224 RepID=A0A5C4WBR1_9ACTN|nr:rod shape-determining protein [Nonomuraea phyllanthi]KAB8193048.1 hypothetical protein FH608_022200 [Nonomuraea phyllanthi]
MNTAPRPTAATTPSGVRHATAGRDTRQAYVALDLGTARTRSLSSGGFAIADRPSAVGSASAVGSGPDGTSAQVRPIRHGMVADPGACLRLVHLVLRDAQLSGAWPLERVLTGVPVAATASDRRALSTAVSEAAGCEATLVEAPLAAAVGAGLDIADPRPYLLLDVGAGIVEAVAVRGGVVVDAAALQLSATTGTGLLPYAMEGVVDMTAALLRRLPEHLRPAARENGLTVTGGGAQQEQLLQRLRAVLRIPVSATPEPQHATIRGLTRLCLQPALAGRVTAQGR